MSASYWTPKTKSTLRQLAVRLEKTQFDGTIYKRLPQSNSHAESYVLSPYHELKLANDLAYLACTEEGVKRISAVCVEEGRNCLTVLVASNETPIPKTVAALQKIGNAISSYAIREIHRDAFLERSFDTVMELSGDRILQRTRPSWAPEPAWHRAKQKQTKTSLLDKLQDLLPQIQSALEQRFPRTLAALKRVHKQLKHLDCQHRDGKTVRSALKIIVVKAHEVSAAEVPRTLEAKLRACGKVGSELAGKSEIRQVDKLGRYYGVCRNFAKMARHSEYRDLLRNVAVTSCKGYAVVPSGSGNTGQLPVHAEVQLTMHYLAQNPVLWPRAMGCSKSACFLCHALITRLGHFSVSACHGKLYSQWTIPDGVLLESKKAEELASAILRICDSLKVLIGVPGARVCPPESRALSLLSGPSTATQLSFDSGSEVSSAETIRPSSAAGPSADPASGSHRGPAELQQEQQLLSSEDKPASQQATRQAENQEVPTAGPAGDQSCQAAALAEGTIDDSLGATSPAQQPNYNEPVASTSKPLSTEEPRVALVRLREKDLPYERHICNDMPLLDLQLGRLSLSLDFSGISIGRLAVTRDSSTDGRFVSLEASELPTSDPGRIISCKEGNNTVCFQLSCFGCVAVNVEITWGTTQARG
ncbi:hypothetical protein MGG_15049 [Pyricularia oryzae 70-15]|uniref:Uncharacterized protein n=1 Tax=Pyricularia oryzae (strain 70-15 / ATCC MYA-4617 / FGSC 8958) TaxID=242507 RepID=G4NKD7_PYRO7|nr:uncharacterized protein MGG_15049 [Pyricularia oryzae 70-15]EHA46573.1 hypothetical protein MGG_15049 [Pyricularia oryzae 70-15]